MDKCRDIEARMLSMASTSQADMTAKLIVSNGYGNWLSEYDGLLIAEALELVKGGAQWTRMLTEAGSFLLTLSVFKIITTPAASSARMSGAL